MRNDLEISPEEWERGLSVGRSQRVELFGVAYNAESHIADTLRRIPEQLRALRASIYVINDRSSDTTSEVARGVRREIPALRVFATPYNQRYGGNQKLGYRYAMREGFDVVVLLHGDGQYAPEVLPRLLAPFADAGIAAAFGSRMMRDPERSLAEIHRVLTAGGTLTASTGNVAYFLVRLMLLLGHFNYGKKGILDLTHTRLFTVRSFCRTLEGAGFRIEKVRGFGPPVVDMVGSSFLLRLLDGSAALLARIWPGLFAYQFVVETTRLDDADDILDSTVAPGQAQASRTTVP